MEGWKGAGVGVQVSGFRKECEGDGMPMNETEDRLLARMSGRAMDAHEGYYDMRFVCMGTENRIAFAAETRGRAVAFRDECLRWLARFEATYSVFLDDSLISRINREAWRDWVAIDADTEQIFAICDWLHWKTRGVMDPTMGPLLTLWDWRVPHAELPDVGAIADGLTRVGWKKVQRSGGRVRFAVEGMLVDLGGIGKEFAVDRVITLAARHNITNILVDLGHDIRVAGMPPEGGAWRLGLEHPDAPGRCWGGVVLTNEALCGSGNYLRFFERGGEQFGHILDPRNGRPVNNGCRAAWVIAPTATEAGALSTAALILGVEEGMRLIDETYQAAGCIWCGDKLHQTRRFANHVAENEAVRA